MNKKAVLRLAGGMELTGVLFGSEKPCFGELVFSTGMSGCLDLLTDPSSCGKIICLSYPLAGNCGVPSQEMTPEGLSINFESEKIWANGLVVAECSSSYSHCDAVESFEDWLSENGVPCLCGVDTRFLTQTLRDNGTMPASIIPQGCEAPEEAYPALVPSVSCSGTVTYGKGDKRIAVLDFGVRHSYLRLFVEKGYEVVRLPWDTDLSDVEYDALFLSSGPGDPDDCLAAVMNVRKVLESDKPVFGMGLGCLVLAKAAGATSFKLKYGHHGQNQPVCMNGSKRCFITTQSHSYALEQLPFGNEWENWFFNMNDGTCEGIRNVSKPFSGVMFIPETSSTYGDTGWIFDDFFKMIGK